MTTREFLEQFDSDLLFETQDYREFLRLVLAMKEKKKPVNYSGLARKAGFRSRSFIKEVLDGKKGLAPRSMTSISKALGFQSLVKTHFENLVKLSETSCNTEDASRELLLRSLSLSRERIRARKNSSEFNKEQGEKVFFSWAVPIVYAALGTIKDGSSIAEVQKRTRLEERSITTILKTLINLDVISEKDGRYFASGSASDLKELGSNELFHSTYVTAVEKLKLRSQRGINSNSELFSYTALSVKASRLPAMKKSFQKLLIEFMDEYQVDQGDEIVKVVVGMFI